MAKEINPFSKKIVEEEIKLAQRKDDSELFKDVEMSDFARKALKAADVNNYRPYRIGPEGMGGYFDPLVILIGDMHADVIMDLRKEMDKYLIARDHSSKGFDDMLNEFQKRILDTPKVQKNIANILLELVQQGEEDLFDRKCDQLLVEGFSGGIYENSLNINRMPTAQLTNSYLASIFYQLTKRHTNIDGCDCTMLVKEGLKFVEELKMANEKIKLLRSAGQFGGVVESGVDLNDLEDKKTELSAKIDEIVCERDNLYIGPDLLRAAERTARHNMKYGTMHKLYLVVGEAHLLGGNLTRQLEDGTVPHFTNPIDRFFSPAFWKRESPKKILAPYMMLVNK